MFEENDEIGVAVSGGKDSASLIYALRSIYPRLKLKAFYVNLGIEGYSDHCEEKARRVAEMVNAEFIVYDLRKEDGVSVDLFRHTNYKNKICSPCGVIKRRLFDVLAKRANVKILATGHNLDDIVSIYLSGFFSGDFTYIARLKPVQPPLVNGFPKKVKPLIRTPEMDTAVYAMYNKLPIREVECPHAKGNVEMKYKSLIYYMEKRDPRFKFTVLSLFLKRFIPLIEDKVEEKSLMSCKSCGFPSSMEICGYCKRINLLRDVKRKLGLT